MLDPGGPSDPNADLYSELEARADTVLRANLRSGAWLATGRDPLQHHDAPRFAVPPDRFAHLEFDFDKSALQGDGVRIIEVLVSPAGALKLFKPSKQAQLGTLFLDISPKSFDLLLHLAEGARRQQLLVRNEVLKEMVFRNAQDKALGQGVNDLWKQLERSGMSRSLARSLVVNVPRRGYYLNLPGVEIFIIDDRRH